METVGVLRSVVIVTIALATWLGSEAFGQQRPTNSTDQTAVKNASRQRLDHQYDPRDEIDFVETLHETVRREIKLTVEQIGDVDRLFSEHHGAVMNTVNRLEERQSADADKVAMLKEQLQQAVRDRDRDRIRGLRAQLREFEGGVSELRRMGWTFDRRMAEVLDAEQACAYRAIVQRLRPGGARPNLRADLAFTVQYILDQLNLSESQRSEIRPLVVEFQTKWAAGADRERKRLNVQLQKDIGAILTPDQRTQFETLRTSAADESRGAGFGNQSVERNKTARQTLRQKAAKSKR